MGVGMQGGAGERTGENAGGEGQLLGLCGVSNPMTKDRLGQQEGS